MSLRELGDRYRAELFETYLPFWEKYGIDHEYGGVMCALDHDGTLVNDQKFHWFQGRGIWVYSFLYSHFGKDPRYLEIAKRTKEFLLAHFPQQDGTWAEVVSREGKVLKPFSGDLFGMYFAAEGLQEYAYAAGDYEAREIALKLVKKLFRQMNQAGTPDPETGTAGVRSQGVWMVTLRTATQILRKWTDPEIAAIADQSVDAVINKHYNPDTGLNTETLNFDFSRPQEEATKTKLGHSIETLWMVMDEAQRRHDQALYDLCAERVRHHLDVGWDHVFGGLADSINVSQGCYHWPLDRPVGTNFEFREVGEYKWVKSSWAFDEVLISTLNIIEHQGSEWAVRYFNLAQETFDKKMSLKQHGLPLFLVYADRRMTFQPHAVRQENYHRPRQYMLNLLSLERMTRRENNGKRGQNQTSPTAVLRQN
jgi:mannose/cellobiose epimerase-like protein (N-acyl-D-glucosamine 2-epimerase family)